MMTAKSLTISIVCVAIAMQSAATLHTVPMPTGQSFTNSLGMKFVLIKAGEFTMGGLHDELPAGLANEGFMRDGDADELPAHKVTISNPFYIGAYEVTNAQFEQFDPSHRLVRGKLGFSIENDEAVVFVSWHDAKAFCE